MEEAQPKAIYQETVVSPVGYWSLLADYEAITSVDFSLEKPSTSLKANKITQIGCQQLTEYFDKKRFSFDLPLATEAYPDFYKAVWSELQQIKYGEMKSYADLAIKLNNPKAVRAVGMANGKNPIPIIIPCHRVIGKDRSLTGYAHGLKVKRWLLELEGAIAETPTLFSD